MNVLIVDDSRVSRMMIRAFISQQQPHWRLSEAGSGDEALKLATQQSFQLVTMDYNMPGLNGIDAASALKALNPNTTVVMLTANVQDSSRSRAAENGLHFVGKPINADAIARVVSIGLEALAKQNVAMMQGCE